MIKLLNLIKEIIDEHNVVWYHGSTADIDQNDLDPLHRDSDVYKKGYEDKWKWSATGSSKGGVGIYFGKDKTSRCATCPMSYTGFDLDAAPYTQGFMYEMKLKPESNIKQYSELHNVSKQTFEKFKQEGIDALSDGEELNLLNPEAIKYFKKIMYWKKSSVLYLHKRGKRIGEPKIFKDDQEMADYLKSELGDYKLIGGKYYVSKDENEEKSFEYTTERKWFNV